jgi:hypothetical protein
LPFKALDRRPEGRAPHTSQLELNNNPDALRGCTGQIKTSVAHKPHRFCSIGQKRNRPLNRNHPGFFRHGRDPDIHKPVDMLFAGFDFYAVRTVVR